MSKISEYRQGGEGFVKWVEENCCLPIYPVGTEYAVWVPVIDLPSDINRLTGRSYRDMWKYQQDVMLEALKMEDGRFLYSLIILCWMRGEGKSLIACLIQLWKFFCFPKQLIVLGANSKEQTKFVHFDIMTDIIRFSPKLLAVIKEKNIQEKLIRFVDADGNIRSTIRPISSFSGIVSNITGYTFSEIFDMKNPKFFVQLDGSTRNIPNALGVIDSTVSDKGHVLYKQYENVQKGLTKKIYFSYRCSKTGVVSDYWNPNMDQVQLDDYRAKFPMGEFERYFLNSWEAGGIRTFTWEMIQECHYIGCEGKLFNHGGAKVALEKIASYRDTSSSMKPDTVVFETFQKKIDDYAGKLMPLSNFYSFKRTIHDFGFCPMETLEKLGKMLNTDWAILAGVDFSDPMSEAEGARTTLVCMAKGLINSRGQAFLLTDASPRYVYLVLGVCAWRNPSPDVVKQYLELWDNEYNGIDSVCSERYGAWDLQKWCEERSIGLFEPIHPSYDRQKAAFTEYYNVVTDGRLKIPRVEISGSKQDDLFEEEMSVFMHSSVDRWFGSPEKVAREKRGIQDDLIFAHGWCMWGGRNIGVEEFRPRSATTFMGVFVPGEKTIGRYA